MCTHISEVLSRTANSTALVTKAQKQLRRFRKVNLLQQLLVLLNVLAHTPSWCVIVEALKRPRRDSQRLCTDHHKTDSYLPWNTSSPPMACRRRTASKQTHSKLPALCLFEPMPRRKNATGVSKRAPQDLRTASTPKPLPR